MIRNAVTYLRVSTSRQGQSGLGLDAQRQAVAGFIEQGEWSVVREFIEIESGRRDDRPQLLEALKACRIHRATLIVAKLDRLARNAHFLLGLRDAGIEFIAVDMPTATRLTISILAMVAEEEAQAISHRTKAALEAAKARGVVLGTPANLNEAAKQKGRLLGAKVRREQSRAWAANIVPVINSIQAEGTTSLNGIAAELTAKGIPTPRGHRWRATQVRRVLLAAA